MVDALFVDPRGPYPRLLGPEHCWDESRDARFYDGHGPVVAHPPCNRWGRLALCNWNRWGHRNLNLLPAWMGGSDGCCFASAWNSVHRWGGVLEHPADTKAWEHYVLRRPVFGQWQKDYSPRGWVTEVWQVDYDHGARKRTWIYYSGEHEPFPMRWVGAKAKAAIGGGVKSGFSKNKRKIQHVEASRTPEAFAIELIRLAEHSQR